MALNLQRRLVLQIEKMFFGFLDLTLSGQTYKVDKNGASDDESNYDAKLKNYSIMLFRKLLIRMEKD